MAQRNRGTSTPIRTTTAMGGHDGQAGPSSAIGSAFASVITPRQNSHMQLSANNPNFPSPHANTPTRQRMPGHVGPVPLAHSQLSINAASAQARSQASLAGPRRGPLPPSTTQSATIQPGVQLLPRLQLQWLGNSSAPQSRGFDQQPNPFAPSHTSNLIGRPGASSFARVLPTSQVFNHSPAVYSGQHGTSLPESRQQSAPPSDNLQNLPQREPAKSKVAVIDLDSDSDTEIDDAPETARLGAESNQGPQPQLPDRGPSMQSIINRTQDPAVRALIKGLWESQQMFKTRALIAEGQVQGFQSRDQAQIKLKQDYDNKIVSFRSEHDRNVANLKSEHEKSVASLKSEHEKSVANLKSEYGKSVASLRAQYANPFATLQREHAATSDSLKNALARNDDANKQHDKKDRQIGRANRGLSALLLNDPSPPARAANPKTNTTYSGLLFVSVADIRDFISNQTLELTTLLTHFEAKIEGREAEFMVLVEKNFEVSPFGMVKLEY
ncbi:hypothetical protein CKM354_000996400 [Cercospora kikuchii]|uniref:Uncharacterized protein n=1 Tax=Cercospora kikuchii TaxID=84275 RepID=A0A9P3CW50_9PEZI|nr:uncharacterized protein CKM354_000996400 [Cercospora kikuchii]GIZ46855.1 hypothetical protein CKM354_000996400 [Cercospora kikuchii]